MKKHKIEISKFEKVITAYAQSAHGPGWTNRPVWVVIMDTRNGSLREECLSQPHQQNKELWELYDISHSVNNAMVSAANKLVKIVR